MKLNPPESPKAANGEPRSLEPREQNRTPPQAKQTRRGLWIIIALVVAAMVVGWMIARSIRSPAAASSAARPGNIPVPVVVGTVTTKNVPIYLNGLGTVEAFNTVTVHSRVDGQLIKVAFTEGQEVHTGDLLAVIDPAPYQAAFDQAAAKKAQDEAQLANARLDLERYANLLKTESVTQQTYDTQQALVNQLTATIKADEGALAAARVNLDYTAIVAPIDGRVGIRLLDQGNVVRAADVNGLVVLTQLRPISVVFTLPEQVLTQLHPQTDAPFEVLAVARDNTNVLARGMSAVVDNQVDTTTGTIKLKATFPNDDLSLWPGQFVNARLHLSTRTNGVVVPASVVQRGPEGAFAFVLNDDQSVAMHSLKVAQIENGVALIDDGLTAGQRVVVDGQYKLQPGSHVKPVGSSATNAAPVRPHPPQTS
jgi:multidrug efflux system membrane fusion protein